MAKTDETAAAGDGTRNASHEHAAHGEESRLKAESEAEADSVRVLRRSLVFCLHGRCAMPFCISESTRHRGTVTAVMLVIDVIEASRESQPSPGSMYIQVSVCVNPIPSA